MALFIVGYDLVQPIPNKVYTNLRTALLSYDNCCWILDSTWLINENCSALSIRSKLCQYIRKRDHLYVIEITNNFSAQGDEYCKYWLKKYPYGQRKSFHI